MTELNSNSQDDNTQEDNTPANYIIGSFLPNTLTVIAKGKSNAIDYVYFTRLLAGSISLSKAEKKKIVDSAETLTDIQFNELIRIFEEEKTKFSKLSAKHLEYLQKLDKQHCDDWIDIESNAQQSSKKKEDEDKAAEIRRQLGL